ncbi:MAG: NAD(P)H-hydrate dehydratase [Flavobacteriales bacterium]|jgi:NAD(P)H-hydrate epimerase|nr:NAD(P)H-hydrate dehydratase [Flavobacteriales bacterium]
MVPVLSPEQVRAADAHTIAVQGIAALELMERAAGRCAARIMERYRAGDLGPVDGPAFVVLAGMGGNGGDGLVIARLLHAAGIPVRVVRVRHRDTPSPEHAANWERLKAMPVPTEEYSGGAALAIGPNELVIDAILGIGGAALSGGPGRGGNDAVRGAIDAVRDADRPVIAVDMPSGMAADDNTGAGPGDIMPATWTLTFEVPKLALLLPENAACTGHWEVLPIGLDSEFIAQQRTPYHVLQEADMRTLLRARPPFAHKGHFGHALVVAGATGRTGAAVLAVQAALRSGAGLVTAHVPHRSLGIMQSTCPEAMCTLSGTADHITDLPPGAWTAVGIGPGMGTQAESAQVVKRLLQDPPGPLTIDADALNIIAEHRTWLGFLPAGTVLTPHPKEFDRLYGAPAASGHERLQRAREMAVRHGATIVLKGAFTAVVGTDGQVTFNATGNPGMAKGGSGDVLTGLVAGLLAQGMAPGHAARLGAWLHGLAGDLAAERTGMDGMTATDLIAALPMAWQRLRHG